MFFLHVDAAAPEIAPGHQAHDPVTLHHHEPADPVFDEELGHAVDVDVGLDGDRVGLHEVCDGCRDVARVPAKGVGEEAGQAIELGEDPDQPPLVVYHRRPAVPLADQRSRGVVDLRVGPQREHRLGHEVTGGVDARLGHRSPWILRQLPPPAGARTHSRRNQAASDYARSGSGLRRMAARRVSVPKLQLYCRDDDRYGRHRHHARSRLVLT